MSEGEAVRSWICPKKGSKKARDGIRTRDPRLGKAMLYP